MHALVAGSCAAIRGLAHQQHLAQPFGGLLINSSLEGDTLVHHTPAVVVEVIDGRTAHEILVVLLIILVLEVLEAIPSLCVLRVNLLLVLHVSSVSDAGKARAL